MGTNTFIDGNSFQARLMAPIIMWPSCWFQLSLISYILFILPLTSVSVSLQLQNSTDIAVVLRSVSLQSTGRYRCEVSGEAPSFQTVSGHEDMIVVGKWARDGNTHRKREGVRERERTHSKINCSAWTKRWKVICFFVQAAQLSPVQPGWLAGTHTYKIFRIYLVYAPALFFAAIYKFSSMKPVPAKKRAHNEKQIKTRVKWEIKVK